jgi:formate dehydrogenase accessory protein FdhE
MAAKNVASDYDGRIRRAERLASLHPFAQEVLIFYKQVAQFQKTMSARDVYDKEQRSTEKKPFSSRDDLKIESLLSSFNDFLTLISERGPTMLAESARKLSAGTAESMAEVLRNYWNIRGREDSPSAAFEQFLPRAFLQPFAEHLGEDLSGEQISASPSLCPLCAARPLLGVLRPEGDGGKRFLLCSFCLREWEFRRIFCATCGEETESKLPVFVAEQFPYIRIDACDTCRFYVRTLDLTKNGNAVPLVDDLAAIPLSLWAEEHGYLRAQPNLLGT